MYIIIPARLESTRVKNKLLREVGGKAVLGYVIEAALKAAEYVGGGLGFGTPKPVIEKVAVCTNSEIIGQYVLDNYPGTDTLVTRHDNPDYEDFINGTERCWGYASYMGLPNSTPIINVQGDSIGITPEVILQMADLLKNTHSHTKVSTMFTLCEKLQPGDLEDESVVKVITNKDDDALLFTRLHYPLSYRHCGLYGYYVAFLNRYVEMDRHLEYAENLEQMRTLENSNTVHCPLLPVGMSAGKSINVEEDLK